MSDFARIYVPFRVDCCSFVARSGNSAFRYSVRIATADCCSDYGTVDSHRMMQGDSYSAYYHNRMPMVRAFGSNQHCLRSPIGSHSDNLAKQKKKTREALSTDLVYLARRTAKYRTEYKQDDIFTDTFCTCSSNVDN